MAKQRRHGMKTSAKKAYRLAPAAIAAAYPRHRQQRIVA